MEILGVNDVWKLSKYRKFIVLGVASPGEGNFHHVTTLECKQT